MCVRTLYVILYTMKKTSTTKRKTFTATEARNDFFAMLKTVGTPGVSIVITYEGHPACVLMSADEFDGWQETMDIMSHPEEAAEILKRLRNKDKEETVTFEALKKNLGLA